MTAANMNGIASTPNMLKAINTGKGKNASVGPYCRFKVAIARPPKKNNGSIAIRNLHQPEIGFFGNITSKLSRVSCHAVKCKVVHSADGLFVGERKPACFGEVDNGV